MLEAESAFGYHSSGRSATYYHFGIGDHVVRGLTAFSRPYFEHGDHHGVGLSVPSAALFVATSEMIKRLTSLGEEMGPYSDRLEFLDADATSKLVPVLKCGDKAIIAGLIDRSARQLDSEALQQNYRAQIKKHGGRSITDARVTTISRQAGRWLVATATGGQFAAPILINAAGAWCDEIARMAGVTPLNHRSFRRTIIAFEAPRDSNYREWPFTKTAVDDFYMLPQGGLLLASPVDEVPSEPADVRPEDYDTALAAAKVELYTSIKIGRIRHSWSGLRTFTPDRVPVAGFAPDVEGFFWLTGQGGCGLQTAPAMSVVTEALITRAALPKLLIEWGITAEVMSPKRPGLSCCSL